MTERWGWESVLEAVRQRLGAPTYEAWFRGLQGSLEGEVLVVRCPDRFSRDRIRERYGALLAELAPPTVRIDYRIESRPERRAARVAEGEAEGAGREVPRRPQEPVLDGFIPGPTNALALEAARAVARGQAGRCSPLVLVGGSGVGKTHLCRGIRTALVESGRPGVVYRSSEEFTSEVTGAMRTGRMATVRERYRRSLNVLILEDIQFLEGKRATQVELFHTLDHLIRHERHVVLSSTRPPHELSGLDEGLRSRVCSGLVAPILPPDAAMRRRILRERAAAGGVRIPDDCLELLAERPVQSVRDLLAGLNQVVARASLLRRPVTHELVHDALSAVSVPGRPRTVGEILALVSRAYATPLDRLRSRSRQRVVVRPRQVAMYLCRRYTEASLKEIGAALARDHTSVMHAVDVVERRIVEQPQLRYELESVVAPLRSA